jgi:hypothetical protein
VPGTDVESLLAREGRARLALHRQLQLYFDPFALFKDASSGPAPARERALSYNRAMRWILVPYMCRWALIAAALFLGIFAVPALAVGSCIALVVMMVTATVYLLLGAGWE